MPGDAGKPNQQHRFPMVQAPPRPPVAPPPPRPPYRVNSGDRRFLVINGRRVWLETPPADVLPHLMYDLR
jgi:hypothetical protein